MTVVAFIVLVLATVAPALATPSVCRTNVYGGLVEEEHWTAANSPYCLKGSIQVSLLTIDPGVDVLADGDYEIEVLSTINALGTADAPIRFGVRTPGRCWQGLRFQFTPAGSTFRHCIIEDSHRSGLSLTSSVPPVMESVLFRHNSSLFGGAINAALIDADLELRECVFDGNTASRHGGAVYVQLFPERTLRVSDATFTNNTSNPDRLSGTYEGGALWVQAGNAVISNTIFVGNSVLSNSSGDAKGGALFADIMESMLVNHSVLASNRTSAPYMSQGAGVFVNSGSVTLQNVVASCNTAESFTGQNGGSGLFVNSGSVSVVNSTLARNTNGTAVQRSGGTLDVSNSIIFFNSGGQIAGNPSVTYSDVQGSFAGTGNIDLNPVFAGTGCSDSDLVVVAGSPCIDTGDPDPTQEDACFPPSRGQARNDMGAHGGPTACNWIPYEIDDLRFTTRDDLTWTKSRISSSYSLYRGMIGAGLWNYNHTCFAASLSAPNARDTDRPLVGAGLYYLATAWNASGESTLGEALLPRTGCSDSLTRETTPRPTINQCSRGLEGGGN